MNRITVLGLAIGEKYLGASGVGLADGQELQQFSRKIGISRRRLGVN
jgi:hypothetical protein